MLNNRCLLTPSIQLVWLICCCVRYKIDRFARTLYNRSAWNSLIHSNTNQFECRLTSFLLIGLPMLRTTICRIVWLGNQLKIMKCNYLHSEFECQGSEEHTKTHSNEREANRKANVRLFQLATQTHMSARERANQCAMQICVFVVFFRLFFAH